MINQGDITFILALYAAIISTAELALHFKSFFEDKAIIQVKFRNRFNVSVDEFYPEIFIDIINKGRRPVTISEVGIMLLNSNLTLVKGSTSEMPKEIAEGKSITIDRSFATVPFLFNQETPLYAWAKDQTGKIYKSKPIPKGTFGK